MNARVLDFRTGQPLQLAPEVVANTPKYDQLSDKLDKLNRISMLYTSQWDATVIQRLEQRFGDRPTNPMERDLKTPLTIKDGQLYIDAYAYGDVHEALFDHHRHYYKVHGLWNKPFPMPTDLGTLWTALYNAFETNRRSKHREYFQNTTVILGYHSDAFMFMDRKYRVGIEMIKMLEHYDVKYIIRTRSDLIAHNEYIEAMGDSCQRIEIRVDRTNDQLNKAVEAGAPSAKRRLKAAQKLTRKGFKVYTRTKVVDRCKLFNINDLDEMVWYGIQGMIFERPDLGACAFREIAKKYTKEIWSGHTRADTLNNYLNKRYDITLPSIIAKCRYNNLDCITE